MRRLQRKKLGAYDEVTAFRWWARDASAVIKSMLGSYVESSWNDHRAEWKTALNRAVAEPDGSEAGALVRYDRGHDHSFALIADSMSAGRQIVERLLTAN
jgi:hypothetical protein